MHPNFQWNPPCSVRLGEKPHHEQTKVFLKDVAHGGPPTYSIRAGVTLTCKRSISPATSLFLLDLWIASQIIEVCSKQPGTPGMPPFWNEMSTYWLYITNQKWKNIFYFPLSIFYFLLTVTLVGIDSDPYICYM